MQKFRTVEDITANINKTIDRIIELFEEHLKDKDEIIRLLKEKIEFLEHRDRTQGTLTELLEWGLQDEEN